MEASQTAQPVRVFAPAKRRLKLRDIWATRAVASMIGARDIKVKYKQAALGPLWLVIGPLGMLLAITIAFSGVTDVNTGDVPYILFALVGLCVWSYIQLTLTTGAQAIIANVALVRRSALPRLALITGTIIGNLPPLGVMLTATIIAIAIYHGFPVQALLLPVLLAWLLVFVWALTAIIAAVAARFRDIVSMIPLLVQAGIFVSPVGYPIEAAPPNVERILILNPVSGLIEAWRWCLLDIPDPLWNAVAIAGAWTVGLLIVGWWIFGRLEVGFADFV